MRVENWQKSFWEVINGSLNRQFEWGKFDCATFAIDCIAAVRSQYFKEDVAKIFGSWSTAPQAARATAVGMPVCGALMFGPSQPTWLLAMGDLGVFKDDLGRETFCIHDGSNFVCPAATGLQKVPFEKVFIGWSI